MTSKLPTFGLKILHELLDKVKYVQNIMVGLLTKKSYK